MVHQSLYFAYVRAGQRGVQCSEIVDEMNLRYAVHCQPVTPARRLYELRDAGFIESYHFKGHVFWGPPGTKDKFIADMDGVLSGA
jgi:hypothetical protein